MPSLDRLRAREERKMHRFLIFPREIPPQFVHRKREDRCQQPRKSVGHHEHRRLCRHQPLEAIAESVSSRADALLHPIGFEEPCLYANFVETADGVVAIPALPQSNKLIAGGSLADRFVMGLRKPVKSAMPQLPVNAA